MIGPVRHVSSICRRVTICSDRASVSDRLGPGCCATCGVVSARSRIERPSWRKASSVSPVNTSGWRRMANQLRTARSRRGTIGSIPSDGNATKSDRAVTGSTPYGWRPTRSAGIGPEARTEPMTNVRSALACAGAELQEVLGERADVRLPQHRQHRRRQLGLEARRFRRHLRDGAGPGSAANTSGAMPNARAVDQPVRGQRREGARPPLEVEGVLDAFAARRQARAAGVAVVRRRVLRHEGEAAAVAVPREQLRQRVGRAVLRAFRSAGRRTRTARRSPPVRRDGEVERHPDLHGQREVGEPPHPRRQLDGTALLVGESLRFARRGVEPDGEVVRNRGARPARAPWSPGACRPRSSGRAARRPAARTARRRPAAPPAGTAARRRGQRVAVGRREQLRRPGRARHARSPPPASAMPPATRPRSWPPPPRASTAARPRASRGVSRGSWVDVEIASGQTRMRSRPGSSRASSVTGNRLEHVRSRDRVEQVAVVNTPSRSRSRSRSSVRRAVSRRGARLGHRPRGGPQSGAGLRAGRIERQRPGRPRRARAARRRRSRSRC